MSRVVGIDVSSYQGVIDWRKAKSEGTQFAILKVIRKDLNPDKRFEENWKNAQDAGVTIAGVYNYSYATTVAKFKSDAQKVVNILSGRATTVWLDIEDKCQTKLGKALVDGILAYKAVIEVAGLNFGVYTGLWFYESHLKRYESQLSGIPFWIARYPHSSAMTLKDVPPASKKPAIKNTLVGWQYSSKGSVGGIANAVDLDEWYETGEVTEVRQESAYYPRYTGTTDSISKALASLGVDGSYTHRKKIAAANAIANYTGKTAQNTKMLILLKSGKLIKD